MRWFRDAFCELEQQQAKEEGVDVHAIMERKASDFRRAPMVSLAYSRMSCRKASGSIPRRLPRFRRLQPRTAWTSRMLPRHRGGRRLCSLADLRVIQEITQRVVVKAVLTGGAAKGELWPQIVAHTLGLALRAPVVEESTDLSEPPPAPASAPASGTASTRRRPLWRPTVGPLSPIQKRKPAIGIWPRSG